MLRVAIAGARGRMGRVATEAFARADGFELAGGLARVAEPAHEIFDNVAALLACKPDVLLDLTTYPASLEISMAAVAHGVRPVIGASGWTQADREALASMVRQRGIGALIVPNFSLGAVVMMQLAEQAARYFPDVAIVKLHHAGKKDKPSGTALATAARLGEAGAAQPPIHSVRLPGLIAHQEVIFGGPGETVTIRHDTLSREAFVPGMLAAVRGVAGITGLAVGLEAVLA